MAPDGRAAHDVEGRKEPEPLREVLDEECQHARFVGAPRTAAGEHERHTRRSRRRGRVRRTAGADHGPRGKKAPATVPGPDARESG